MMKVAASVLLFSLSFTAGVRFCYLPSLLRYPLGQEPHQMSRRSSVKALLRDAGIPPKDHGPLEEVPLLDEDPERHLSDSDSSSNLFQVDPKITRPQLVSAHTKWLICSNAFWKLGNGQCETKQRYVPYGYWFETGRPVPKGTNCSALTGKGDIPVANCRFKRGLTMVLPAANYFYVGCTNGILEDPRNSTATLLPLINDVKFVKKTLDDADVDSLDAITVIPQDGDFDYKHPTVRDRCVVPTPESQIDFLRDGGCPVSAMGPYVFINTTKLTLGTHELILIGKFVSGDGCSAVKHVFTLY